MSPKEQDELLADVKRAIVEAWNKNLFAENALPVIGHVLLGAAIKWNPKLNLEDSYYQPVAPELENLDTLSLSNRTVTAIVINSLTNRVQLENIITRTVFIWENVITNRRFRVVGGSLRMAIIPVASVSHPAEFSIELQYMTKDIGA